MYTFPGREARLPVELSGKKAEVGSEEDFESKLKGLQELRRKVHANALANISKAQKRQKQHYDKNNNTGTQIRVEDMHCKKCELILKLSSWITFQKTNRNHGISSP